MPSEAQVIGGHKANLHNPNTSAEAKDHSKDVLKDEHNCELSPHDYISLSCHLYGHFRLTQVTSQ